MRLLGSLVFSLALVSAEEADKTSEVLQHLTKQANAFEQNADHFTATETLRQTIPAGLEVSRVGVETKVPERVKTVVSEFGYVPVDEKGGSIRESRQVLTVDGTPWKDPKKASSRQVLTAEGLQQRRRLLEHLERAGLHGAVSDISQSILLFSRGRESQYTFTLTSSGEDDSGTELMLYEFQQQAGSQAITIFEGKRVLTEKLHGKLWVRAENLEPVRIGLETTRKTKHTETRDTVVVSYQNTTFGILLPVRAIHEQYEDGELAVVDDYVYSDWKQVIPSSKPR